MSILKNFFSSRLAFNGSFERGLLTTDLEELQYIQAKLIDIQPELKALHAKEKHLPGFFGVPKTHPLPFVAYADNVNYVNYLFKSFH